MNLQDSFLCPGNGPYAACALIFNSKFEILAVSRKDNFNDFNLIGGKVDPGENFFDACIRETQEETGLVIISAVPFFGNYCGKTVSSTNKKMFWTLTHFCQIENYFNIKPENNGGLVKWIQPNHLLDRKNSFYEYNKKMLEIFSKTSYWKELNKENNKLYGF